MSAKKELPPFFAALPRYCAVLLFLRVAVYLVAQLVRNVMRIVAAGAIQIDLISSLVIY